MSSTWIVTDTHFGWPEENLVRFLGRHRYWYDCLVDTWRATVKDDDTVYHLGDLGQFAGNDGSMVASILATLPGRKILVKGNHDTESTQYYQDLGFATVFDEPVTIPWGLSSLRLSHEPLPLKEANLSTQALCGHLHNVDPVWWMKVHPEYREVLQWPGQKFIALEYSGYRPLPLTEILTGMHAIDAASYLRGLFFELDHPEQPPLTEEAKKC